MTRSVKIGVSKLQVEMFIGINEEEIENKQKVLVDVECDVKNLSHHIDDTLDYRIFESICTELAANKKYDLIETFAKDIIMRLMSLKNINSIKLKVSKPSAIKNAKEAYIIIEQFS